MSYNIKNCAVVQQIMLWWTNDTEKIILSETHRCYLYESLIMNIKSKKNYVKMT